MTKFLQAVQSDTKLLSLDEFKDLFTLSMVKFLKNYLGELEKPIIDLVEAGGKRIRPYLIYLFAYSPYQGVTDNILLSGLLPELIHTASLVHDDIIDNTEIRRGQPTIHANWNTRIAVLSGDLIFAQVLKTIGKITFTIPSLVNEIVSTIEDMIEGQTLEEKVMQSNTIPETALLEHINELKTASLFSLSFYIGLALRGEKENVLKKAKKAGKIFGTVFQIYDDLTDIFGREEIMGKDHLNDIKEGTITIPIAIVCQKDNTFKKLLNTYNITQKPDLLQKIRTEVLEIAGDSILEHTQESAKAFKSIIQELNIYTGSTLISLVDNLQNKIAEMLITGNKAE